MSRKFDLLKVLAIIASLLTTTLITIHNQYSSDSDKTFGDDLLHPRALCRPPAAVWAKIPHSFVLTDEHDQ